MNNAVIKEEIAKEDIKVVSFDIFDTLLSRPCTKPINLFRIVGRRCGVKDSFEVIRREAEQIARRNCPDYEDDITLDDIYAVMQNWNFSQFSKSMIDELKKTEFEVEEEYLYPRTSIQDVYNYALELGKKIIITSDMYLPVNFIESVLEKNGYRGYAKLYLSSEYKLTKKSKRLFEKIIEDFKGEDITADEIIHIGDNRRSDYENAIACGMKAFHAESPITTMSKNKYFSSLIAKTSITLDNTFLIGRIANEYFDLYKKPVWNNSYFDGKFEYIMSIIMTPFIFSFVKWMLDDCISSNINTLVLVYRDGYIPDEIVKRIRNLYVEKIIPDIKRVDLSRRALLCLESKNENGLLDYLALRPENPKMSVRGFLELVIGITSEEDINSAFSEITEYGYNNLDDCIGDTSQKMELATVLHPYFKKYGDEYSIYLEEYLHEELDGCGKIAVFDIGYRGRISRILTQRLKIENRGYHLIQFTDQCRLPYIVSCVTSTRNVPHIHNAFLEDIVSAQIPSVRKIKKINGSFELIREKNYVFSEEISVIQELLLHEVDSYVNTWGSDLADMTFDPLEFYLIYREFLERPGRKDVMMMKDFSFQNDNDIQTNFYSDWYAKFYGKNLVKESVGKTAQKYFNEEMGGFESSNSKFEAIVKKFQNAISEVYNISKDNDGKNRALWLGANMAFDKGTIKYMETIMNRYDQFNWLILSDAVGVNYEKAYKTLYKDVIVLPEIPQSKGYTKGIKIDTVPLWAESLLKEKPYIRNSVEAFICEGNIGGNTVDRNYAVMLFVYYYKLYRLICSKLKPHAVLIWCKFMPAHSIFAEVCRENKIEPIFVEFGLLPGTFNVEVGGQMGESYVSRMPDKFDEIEVTDDEITSAAAVIEALKENKNNRNVQVNDKLKITEHPLFKKGCPIITYFGQNETCSSLYPYTDVTRRYHSPKWKSNTEPLTDLVKLGKKNNWNIVYKPHPSIANRGQSNYDLPEGVIYVEKCNLHQLLDASDVVVTILSQVSYEALIRDKAVVMLGYNQLRKKGCTYECFDKSRLGVVLNNALNEGYTDEMKKKFIAHTARLLKTVLYDDLNTMHDRYGRTIEQLDDVIISKNPYRINMVSENKLNLIKKESLPYRLARKCFYLLPEKVRKAIKNK